MRYTKDVLGKFTGSYIFNYLLLLIIIIIFDLINRNSGWRIGDARENGCGPNESCVGGQVRFWSSHFIQWFKRNCLKSSLLNYFILWETYFKEKTKSQLNYLVVNNKSSKLVFLVIFNSEIVFSSSSTFFSISLSQLYFRSTSDFFF